MNAHRIVSMHTLMILINTTSNAYLLSQTPSPNPMSTITCVIPNQISSASRARIVIYICIKGWNALFPLQWRHNGCDGVSSHQPHDCLLNCLFKRRSKKTLKLHVTGVCMGNSRGTGDFPAQRTSNVENASIWWRHHAYISLHQNLLYPVAIEVTSLEARTMPLG